MPRPSGLVERGMEAQVAITACQKACAPLYKAALTSGDFDVMAEMHALAGTLRVAAKQARRLTGFAEGIECPDGRVGLWHGKAA